MKRLVLCLLLASFGCKEKQQPTPPNTAAQDAVVAPDAGSEEPKPEDLKATATGELLATVDATAKFHASREPLSWLDMEKVAAAHMTRARLTGSVDEYLAAEKALQKAFELAPDGAGPFLTRAKYLYAIHLNDNSQTDVDQDAKRLLRKTSDEAVTAGMRGDFAFHQGDLETARKLYEESIKLHETGASVARLAFLDMKTGRADEARKGYERAAELSKSDNYQLGWALLHRGIVDLETGDTKSALDWYTKADEAFSGWYLIEEHIAEAKLLLGDPDGAIALYESIIARNPSGEFMGAMAECYAAKGDDAKQAEWVARATEAFERDVAKLPSAASGHALEFFLEHDHKRALQLAEKNVELRPNHEARMQLAQALLANGRAEDARNALEPVLDTSWDTPDFHATVALAYRGSDEARATKAATAAAAHDPEAVAGLEEMLALKK